MRKRTKKENSFMIKRGLWSLVQIFHTDRDEEAAKADEVRKEFSLFSKERNRVNKSNALTSSLGS